MDHRAYTGDSRVVMDDAQSGALWRRRHVAAGLIERGVQAWTLGQLGVKSGPAVEGGPVNLPREQSKRASLSAQYAANRDPSRTGKRCMPVWLRACAHRLAAYVCCRAQTGQLNVLLGAVATGSSWPLD
ncbi:hypothetical protein BN2475_670001 [Paraburkholderia ribeironis]|uniref:Uncharacterized protein n=1 Tax=Paraburkholderia ribeironis TaxID=1247936 RepID=A0A1N7SGP5_9BURK|nr:hypothetical protein BN2475_670001 [Paraburkholderia ribeironis]